MPNTFGYPEFNPIGGNNQQPANFGFDPNSLGNFDFNNIAGGFTNGNAAAGGGDTFFQALGTNLKGFGGKTKDFLFGDGIDQETGIQSTGSFAPIAQGLLGAGSLALGFKQLGQSERVLDQQEEQFERNFGAQQEAINRRLQDREYARARFQGQSHEDATASAKTNVEKFGAK